MKASAIASCLQCQASLHKEASSSFLSYLAAVYLKPTSDKQIVFKKPSYDEEIQFFDIFT